MLMSGIPVWRLTGMSSNLNMAAAVLGIDFGPYSVADEPCAIIYGEMASSAKSAYIFFMIVSCYCLLIALTTFTASSCTLVRISMM
ncbi:MAG: hypothetical protein DI588_18245 [Flavobacterium johnsoniae]|nr:MAG: hypothetical protein DI588_18245 [Flavobacterium johnsoniae]